MQIDPLNNSNTSAGIPVSAKPSPPVRQRLLKKPHFRRGRELPMNERQRRKVMERAKAERAFNEKHPWWPKLHGQEREMWRKIKFCLLQRGLNEEADDIWDALQVVGTSYGKDIVADVIEHLFGGDEFDAEGLHLISPYASPAKSKCESLVAFVQARVPADRIDSWSIIAWMTFKARIVANKLVREELKAAAEKQDPQPLA